MRILLCCFGLLFVISVQAVTLREDAPARYTVQSGDSLWGIANRYLKYPWEWKALWHANPAIKNPHHLYAGAVITLRYNQKRPYLKVLSNGTIKLSPHVRPVASENSIPTIPLADLLPFFNESVVLDRNMLHGAPYVIAFMNEHLLGGQGDEVYVKNLCPKTQVLPPGVSIAYAIYRPCGSYWDPITKQRLGYKTTLVGYGELVRAGDPATVVITDIVEGIRLYDKVMPNNYPDFDLSFEPKSPMVPVRGDIIDLPGDYTQGGVGLVAVIDRGQDAGLQPGDVLGVYTRPRLVNNLEYHYVEKPPCEYPCVPLPPERIGEVMVFRTFSRTSIALVVRSTRAIKKFDTVTNP